MAGTEYISRKWEIGGWGCRFESTHLRDLLELTVGLRAFLCGLHCPFVVVKESFVHAELAGLQDSEGGNDI